MFNQIIPQMGNHKMKLSTEVKIYRQYKVIKVLQIILKIVNCITIIILYKLLSLNLIPKKKVRKSIVIMIQIIIKINFLMMMHNIRLKKLKIHQKMLLRLRMNLYHIFNKLKKRILKVKEISNSNLIKKRKLVFMIFSWMQEEEEQFFWKLKKLTINF